MKLAKTSAIAFAVSAMLVGPVLAQGVSTDAQIRGGVQGQTNMQSGGSTVGSCDEEFNAKAGAATERAGARAGASGTVGSGAVAPKNTGTAPGGKH